MTDRYYSNDASQLERKQILKENSQPTTVFDQARIGEALQRSSSIHSGDAKFVPYPMQDPTSP